MNLLKIVFVLLSVTVQAAAQVVYLPSDSLIFEKCMQAMDVNKYLPLQDLVVQTALYFEGTPYVASTLEQTPEQLVVNLREFDCTTFVESVLALSYTRKDKNPSFQTYCMNLKRIRYREEIKDYSSRLHYTTDWIQTNEKRGFVKDISQQLGGVILPVNLYFMSTNADKYKQLLNNPQLTDKIRQQEQAVNALPHYYVPVSDIDKRSGMVKSGDMVCFVTTIKGLDVSHVGFALHKDGILTFIHASLTAKKVIVNPISIQAYVEGIKHNNGVLFVRPLEQSLK